jgi:hypothetical protein
MNSSLEPSVGTVYKNVKTQIEGQPIQQLKIFGWPARHLQQ